MDAGGGVRLGLMSRWDKLSGGEEQKRAAAFEARVIAELTKDAPAPQTGIQVIVNGQRYDNLAAVPAPVRQQILSAWQPAIPPVIVPASPATRTKSQRMASTLNLFLPGAGQIYLGEPAMGSLFALSFLACFTAAVILFVRAYWEYMQTVSGSDILEAGNLEKLSNVFPGPTLVVLTIVAVVIYIASAIHLSRLRRRDPP